MLGSALGMLPAGDSPPSPSALPHTLSHSLSLKKNIFQDFFLILSNLYTHLRAQTPNPEIKSPMCYQPRCQVAQVMIPFLQKLNLGF